MSRPPEIKDKGAVLIVATALALLLPWVLGPALVPTPHPPRPARVDTAARPGWTSWSRTRTYEAIETWLSDRVRARPWARGLVAGLGYFTVGQSSSERIIVGRHGWLFWSADFTGACGMPPATFSERLRALLDRLEASARTGGRRLVFVVVPDKSTAESERLGPWGRDALARCSAPLREVLERVSAARPVLAFIPPGAIARWGEGPSWTPGDTHWTPLASRALLESVLTRRGVPAVETRRIVEASARGGAVQFPGDLYRIMGLLGADDRDPVASMVGTSQTTFDGVPPPGRRWVTGNPLRTTEREVAVVGDSFLEQPMPAVAATWGCGTSATWSAATWAVLPGTADLVILESVQRFVRVRLAQLERPDSAPFWRWLATPAPSGPSPTCPAPHGS